MVFTHPTQHRWFVPSPFVEDKESVLIPTSIAAIKSRLATLKKRMKDGSYTEADLQQLASIGDEATSLSLTATPSLVVSA